MSAEIDFSQYRRKNNQSPSQASQNDFIDFSVYKKKPKEVQKQQEKEKRTPIEKAGRLASQFALGAAESAVLPYEIAVTPLKIPGGQEALGDLFTRDTLSEVYPTEEEGKNLKPRELKQPIDIGIRGLTEKITGLDLHPEGTLEKAANWTGFIKNPKNIKEIAKLGTSAKEIAKSLIPGKDIFRGLGAGTALQMAEEGKFGILGTMGAAIIGDLMGGAGKGILKAALKPKESLAKATALLSNSKKSIVNDLKEASHDKKFTKDIGTLTDNNMVKMIQARLTASGLTGKPLENLRKKMTQEVADEYESIANKIGELRFSTINEAGEIAQKGLKEIRDADLSKTRSFYQSARSSLKENATVESKNLATKIENLEKELKPGNIKSGEQQKVLSAIEDLKKDIYDSNGRLKYAGVKELMNNKIALNDLINYEVQGGAKQLLKSVVGELDRAIISHGKENIPFVRNYITANKRFSEHAKTFRNQNIDKLLKTEDPIQIMNKMNSVQGIKDIRKVLYKTPEGKKIFDSLARKKMDLMIGDNMKDGITEQLKSSKFVNLLEKNKNKEIIKELVPPEAYKKLLKLQKHVGKLAESAQKFFNASQSATAGADLAVVGGILSGIGSMFIGNAWPINAVGIYFGAKELSKLIADPKFLNMVEEAIKSSEKSNISLMEKSANKIVPYFEKSIPKATQEGIQKQELAE